MNKPISYHQFISILTPFFEGLGYRKTESDISHRYDMFHANWHETSISMLANKKESFFFSSIVFDNSIDQMSKIPIKTPAIYYPGKTILKTPFFPNSYETYFRQSQPTHYYGVPFPEFLHIEDLYGYNIIYNRECIFQKILLENGIAFIEKLDFWNHIKDYNPSNLLQQPCNT